MFPNYSCFVSYTPVTGNYAILGDETLVEIKGCGMAVYCLNGKVIKTLNALHITSLQGPLFSLRRQCLHQGCDIYLPHMIVAFILFPKFILAVNYSHDNLRSFELLGRSYSGSCDYAQPK